MSTQLVLFFANASPPARACLLLARCLELDIEVKHVNLIAESRAIMAYLVNSKKPGSDLYPTDPQTRALVDQKLYFVATVFAVTLQDLVRPGIYYGAKRTTQSQRDAIRKALKTLDGFLNGRVYLVGTKLTIADISILPSVTSIVAMGYILTNYDHLNRWLKKLSGLPGFEENQDGGNFHAKIVGNIYENSLF